eukprot:CAMPEP_0168424600 /NCGR_PEP_ID=MMETSP0228-20121227/34903_1 /TAXON_ID=133427 /ORGANISM="Protoceratium reticulatum, Strain CCCM 535 (=CCMP 1889)" /LENGTH=171 /DNA_ID=CAMNT_0008438589 /DNA_START=59 /DNA_END=571 /DNA_ORIENTATION=-
MAAEGPQSSGATAALMFGVNFVVNLAISIVAPILPHYLAVRQLLPPGSAGGLVRGLLFSSSPMATLVTTPLGPLLMRRFGKRATCAGGILLFAAAILVFGLSGPLVDALAAEAPLPAAAGARAELALLFTSRVLAAVGGTAAMLSSMSIAMDANPENRGALVGASETAIGV